MSAPSAVPTPRMFRFSELSRPFAIAVGVCVAVSGCDTSPTFPSPAVLTGVWGGDHVSLSIMATRSHLEFDCSHGTIPGPLTSDGHGRFAAAGTFVREHGGPIREDEVPDAHPAMYAGTVTDSVMQLTVRLTDANELIGTFSLTHGAPGRVMKCL